MSIWRLVLREIGYRKLNAGLAVLAVALAVGCAVGLASALRFYDEHTEQLLTAREDATKEEMRNLEEQYRKITVNMGFNLTILARDQDLNEFHLNQAPSRTLPEEYGERLARARVVTVNHLLPVLHERVEWPEQKGLIVHVVGTRGEIPIEGHQEKKPIRDAVKRGTMVLGYELQKRLKVKAGDALTFRGEEFAVRKGDTPRGTAEDYTVWLHLEDAQTLLKKPKQINMILALECDCTADRLDKVKAEITKVLPDTQVVEKSAQAEARARARNQARATASAAVEHLRKDRDEGRERWAGLVAAVVPVVLGAVTLLLGFLFFSNVRDRRGEIGLLRAVGVSSWSVAVLVLGRSLLVGLLGALAGYILGAVAALLYAGVEIDAGSLLTVLDPAWAGAALAGAVVWCGLTSLLPALVAARQDPALVLCEA
jgi:hypothetical protein